MFVSWGEGDKYDESAETRTRLISIIGLHLAGYSDSYTVLSGVILSALKLDSL